MKALLFPTSLLSLSCVLTRVFVPHFFVRVSGMTEAAEEPGADKRIARINEIADKTLKVVLFGILISRVLLYFNYALGPLSEIYIEKGVSVT